MLYYLLIFILGILMGFYIGNKKFQRAVSRAIRAFRKSKDEDELYNYENEDEE